MANDHSLINMNIHFLRQGRELLQSISDTQYQFSDSPYFSSSAGKHMRHVLDHYVSLLEGWDSKINYDARQRDVRIEEQRSFAIEHITRCISGLEEMANGADSFNKAILVKSNEAENGSNGWSNSSVTRELQFLIGHTVHHYALVAFILRVQDFAPAEEFGVAPSTLKYEQQTAQKS